MKARHQEVEELGGRRLPLDKPRRPHRALAPEEDDLDRPPLGGEPLDHGQRQRFAELGRTPDHRARRVDQNDRRPTAFFGPRRLADIVAGQLQAHQTALEEPRQEEVFGPRIGQERELARQRVFEPTADLNTDRGDPPAPLGPEPLGKTGTLSPEELGHAPQLGRA